MAIFKRNIWTIFYFLIFCGVVFMSVATAITWRNINEIYGERLVKHVELVSNTLHSHLLTQEMMMGILSDEVSTSNFETDKIKVPEIFDRIVKFNLSITALGLVDSVGKYIYVSVNKDVAAHPDMKVDPFNAISFERALRSDHMIIGRTFYFKPAKEWVIPLFKSVHDSEGNVIVTIIALLGTKDAADVFNNKLHASDNIVQIVRGFDRNVQYVSAEQTDLSNIYNQPILDKSFNNASKSLQDKYGLNIYEAMDTQDIYYFNIRVRDGLGYMLALRYNKQYELWTLSGVYSSVIRDAFISKIRDYYVVFVIVALIIFLLFRYIANAENKLRKSLIFQANHDSLTELPNRNYLHKNIHKWIHKDAEPFCLIFVDMDNFKSVNDSFGHYFGDKVLVDISERFISFVDKESLIVRQGGDEFVILCYEVNPDVLLERAKLLIEILSLPYLVGNTSFVIGASVGIAIYPAHGGDLDSLLRAADIALYESKKHKNSAYIFDESMVKVYLDKVEIEQELHNAIKLQELYMVYQPQCDLDNKLIGVESLIRWQNPKLGLVSPASFIPIAETAGLMPKLGDFIVDSVLADMQEIQLLSNKKFSFSINISMKQFIMTDFMVNILSKIEASDLDKIFITLEITENLFIEDINNILPVLNSLHRAGIKISLDDFGTGYSSLNVLRMLPIDELKIDKSFVDDILTDNASQKMIQNIVAIGKNLELAIVAEGVETKEQKDMLISYGCDHFQGYYFSHPLKKEDLLPFLKKCGEE